MSDSTRSSSKNANETPEQRERRLAYHREWMRRHRAAHPEKAKEVARRHYAKAKDKLLAYKKKLYAEKREQIIAQVCAYAKRNRDKINARRKAREAGDPVRAAQLRRESYLRRREKDKASRQLRRDETAAYMRHKRNSDPVFLVADRLRRRINYAVSASGASKAGRLVDVSGCSVRELVAHIESQFTDGMSWENKGKWQIDHIIPCSAFDLTDTEQQKIAFHYLNLRPVWSSVNQRKGAKIPGGQRKLFWCERDISKAKRRLA